MTREEIIEQQIFVYYETCSDEDIAKSKGFIDGANWADQHPREGLVDIEKACKWLDENAYLHVVDGDSVTSLLEYFRKAMEE